MQADKNGRILKVLSAMLPQSSFGELSSALRKKDVLVNGARVKENVAVSLGDELVIFLPDAKEVEIPVVYEDDDIVIVNKGKHVEVCDGEYNLVGLFESKGKTVLPVHRLDRNTEGLVIFAKSQLKNVSRTYLLEINYYFIIASENWMRR